MKCFGDCVETGALQIKLNIKLEVKKARERRSTLICLCDEQNQLLSQKQ